MSGKKTWLDLGLSQSYGPLTNEFKLDFQEGYNVLIGANNSGKSSILHYVFKLLVLDLMEYGPDSVCLILPERIFVDPTSETGGRTLENHNRELATLARKIPITYNNYNSPPRSELSKLLLTHSDWYSQIGKLRNFLRLLNLPEYIIGPGQNISFENISVGFQGSGLRSLLPIIAALTDPKIKVVLIDEPELSLEPRIQKDLRDLFYEASTEKIIIVSSHSHLFLNRKSVQSNFIITRVDAQVTANPVKNETQLYDLTFGLLGSSLSDLFFPENFIVVEGSSDQVLIEKFLQLKGVDKYKIKVVSAVGLEKIKDTIGAIEKTLLPLVLNDSPYSRKVVALIDKQNLENRTKVKDLKSILKTRLFELSEPTIEEYIPESFYAKAGRDKQSDIEEIKRLKSNYDKLKKLKKEISEEICTNLVLEDLEDIPIIKNLILKAI